ncbi:uncharacterized protein LOC133966659 isoform X2 [Platichthys flesus]|uniref:uncharacterized protein LOC133966659 isoform X2 n=1 Tax=Platichthys flesus TaxID=8260 RepID=UPI002DB6FE1B|nr:uncharacterized protein LOC133966659 isoform X2 [Platichthys flesus]
MTSVEKRRSGRKSGRHRKNSDTSNGGSFLDETDREVSSLTDRAFRSLCIGDEAVYNDSDLCSSSPCGQRDRQLAFSQGGQDRDREDREREELKRAAHESFSVKVQQYGQDLMRGGMYGAEIQRDPQWEAYGERTRGRLSATFQQSFVETSQQERSLREDQLSFFSNGATDLSSQQRRSRSRVSSLIRAFNSDGQRDGAGTDGKPREWNNETSWDNSALMNIQRELSDFSSSYQQNFNSDPFLTGGQFTSQNSGFYSSEVAAVAHTNSASTFMSASHSKHSMSTQVNCNSNFFIHSEFSPFKVWRDHNRFPFQQRDVSGFMHCSEFPKWYETPMYRELSQEARPQGPYRFEERGIGNLRNNMVPMVPPSPQRSTSTFTMLQKASAVEKRSESELAGRYPHRKRMEGLGTNKLPPQRPSTASPTPEMSRRVRDTISSVKALQRKIKMMAEQNMEMEMKANQQEALCSNDNLIPFGNSAVTGAANVVRGNTTPLNISQLLTPSVHANQDAGTSVVREGAVSPELVEHAPVRAESRGATPDIRGSSYKSRATSLLFNLKDNRKRVKNTYSPTKFKQPSVQEPRDTVIDIPDYPDPDIQFTQVEEFSRTSAASHQYANQYQNPGLSLATENPRPKTAPAGQCSEYTLSEYQTAKRQSEMVQHHSTSTGFTPENYTTNQLANGQYLHEDLMSYTSYKQSMRDNAKDEYRLKPSYTATEAPRKSVNNPTREYFISRANAEQHFNETAGRESTKVDRYQQPKDNKHDYSNVSTQDRWRQTNSQDTERLGLKATVSPWKQEITALTEKEKHAQAYQSAAPINEELNLPRDKYRGGHQQSVNAELETRRLRHVYGAGLANPNITNQLPQYAPEISNSNVGNQEYYGQQQAGTIKDKYALQKHHGHNETKNYLTQNYERYAVPENQNQPIFNTSRDKTMCTQETGQRQYMPVPKGHEMQSLQPLQVTTTIGDNVHKYALSNPDNATASTITLNQVKDKQLADVNAGQATAEISKVELAKVQHRAQVEPPKAESARLNLAGQTGSEKVKAQQAKAELTERERDNPAKMEEKKKGEQREKPREKHSEHAREEQRKAREQKITEEPRNKKEEVAMHMKEEQVKADQARAVRLKEQHIKTELAPTEQLRIQKTTQVRREEEEQVKAQQIEREQRETERTRTEKIKAEQAKTEQEKMKVVEMQNFKADHIKVKDVKQEKLKMDLIKARVNSEQTIPALNKAKEQTKVKLAKAEPTKTEDLQERLVKPGSKLAAIQTVKSEPDKVEKVKTELAKAKAELAKITEKMKGEQKEKVRKTNIVMEKDIAKKDVDLNFNMNKNEDYKNQDGATQMHQLNEDSLDRGADDFNCLRGKYGFTNALTTNRKEELTAKNYSSNDDKETTTISPATAETVNNKKSNDKQSPASVLAKANTENKDKSESLKSNEETEGHYVYSESSKEFKLSCSDNLPTHVDNRANCDTVTDKVKDESVETLEKCEAAKLTDVSHQRDSDLMKLLPLERKPKSVEHSVGPGKDLHFTPPRASTHKERAQTKQEILTSRIKAHAEKEISAIKEKGFAIRDGFISKNSTKVLAASQSLNICQRPPSQEVFKKHESTMSSNFTPKRQMEQSGVQTETVKSLPTPSSATIPVKSGVATGQSVDHLQKQVPKEPVISNDHVQETTKDEKLTGCDHKITDKGLIEKQNTEIQYEVKSLVQSEEQAPVDNRGKQKSNHGTNPGKHKDRLKDKLAISTGQQNKEKEDLSTAISLVKAESTKPMTSEKPEGKHEELHEDSAPSINPFSQDQNKTPVADESLQIMGIMVIVRERKPSESDNTDQEQINTKDKEHSNSELDKCHPSSSLEVSTGKYSPKENSIAKEKERVGQELLPTVGVVNHSENVSENVPVKKTDLQKSTSIDAKPQTEMRLQEPLAEKGVPSTVTAKNKVLADTQHPSDKQDMKDKGQNDYSNKMPKQNLAKDTWKDEVKNNIGETNDPKKTTAHTDDNLKAKVENTGIKNDSNKADADALVKSDVQQSSTADDGECAHPMEEKRNDPTPLKPFNNTTPSQHLPENQINPVSPRFETHTQVEDVVHIDSIAIRVVPTCAATKNDNLNTVGKNAATVVPADVLESTEHKEVASSSSTSVNTSTNKDRIKDLTPEDKFGVQYVLSSVKKLSDSLKISKQQDSIKLTTESTQAESQRFDDIKTSRNSVDKSHEQAMEGDYFQLQGVADTNNDLHNSANGGETLDGVSNERIPPASLNRTSVNEEVKNDAFSLNQSKRETMELSTVGVRTANVEKKNRETETLKQSDGPTERQEVGQANHLRKSRLSARERQSSRNAYLARDNAVKEKPEVQPKPKEKVSTIPEISALADYARLKVIVSEEEENTIQEFPPNKKEGFFPLIQSRHSRRPVFTDDPKDIAVKKKHMPNKTEMIAKVNREPKAFIFPITEKEHQRTGMFKLGDKDKQEKMVLDAPGASDAGAKNTQPVKRENKSLTTHLKNQLGEEQVAGSDTQIDQRVPQPVNPPLQSTTSSSAVNRPRNTSASQQLKSLVNSDPHKNHDEITTQTKEEKLENKVAKSGEERKEATSSGGIATQHEETTPKPSQEELMPRIEEEKRTEDMRIKHIMEESRASLAEEERRATQREEERRAKEREAIARRIKERREKQREADKKEEKERKAKQTKDDRTEGEIERSMSEGKLRGEADLLKDHEEWRMLKQKEEERASREDPLRKASEEEQQRKGAPEEQQRRVTLMEEQQRRATPEEQQIRATPEEQQRKAAKEEQQSRAALIEVQQRRAAQEEQQRRPAQEEQQRRAAQEEKQRKAAQEEQQMQAAKEEQQRRAAQEEQQRKTAQEEKQRKAAQEEQQMKSAKEEQQRKAALEEQQWKAAKEEQQRRATLIEEQQRKAAQEEQQRKAAQEEQQRRTAKEEQQWKAAKEEQQRRAGLIEEQQRIAAQEDQQRKAAQEEKQRKAAQEEQQRRVAQEEQQWKAAKEEQQRRTGLIEEQQRRAAQEEQQRKAAQEEKQRKAAQEEQQRTAAQEEKQRKAAQEEKQRRAAQDDQQRKAAQEEQKRRAAQEEQQITAALIEEKQRKSAQEEQQRIAKQREEKRLAQIEQEKRRTQGEEEDRKAAEKEKTILKLRVEKQAKEERTRSLEESKAEEGRGEAQEEIAQREDEIMAKRREEEEMLVSQREKERAAQMEELKRAAQMRDALQYYAISSTEPERKSKERQVRSPLPSQQKHHPSVCESTEDSGYPTRSYRPPGSASPAPSLPRSNTSSPALGGKLSMFRVKDNTIRSSPFTKSVKPRFHKNFGEELRVGSPMERVSEREEEQGIMRHSAGINRHAVIKESSSQDYSAHLPQHRPYSRRSIVLDEDDSRSVMSNMSEDVESFATSAADLADTRGLYDFDRPESACSFSSDVSRSMGRPPVVPPKSDKALRRAKRLTTRRMKKETCRAIEDGPAGVGKPLQEVPRPSSSTEVHSSNKHAVASPHFSSPVSLAHAPAMESGLPSSRTERTSSHHAVHTSPNASGPGSLPVASPFATASVILPVASPHATGPVSHTAAPKTVSHVSSSPTLHHANHPAPVTQYHVESSYPQSYPLTQRKTGEYVQLNVRESGKSPSQPQSQQNYSQPQLQTQTKSQQQPISQASPTGKPLMLYQGYHGYSQGYQPAAVNSMPPHSSSAPMTHQQNQQSVRENHSYGYPVPEMRQYSEGHRYSPEKTPYMDTVNDTEKTYNKVYNTHGSYEAFPECDTNSQLAGSSVCENENSAHSRYQPRDIIPITELEDFMEVSDW